MNSNESIPEDEFFGVWGAHKRQDENYFTFDDVKDKPVELVWSVIEGDESIVAVPGFHVVNMLGYMMTTKPWTDEGVWCLLWDGELD